MMTMRQKIAGKSPEQIRKIKRSELEAPVSMTDLGAAMEKTRRTVTQVSVLLLIRIRRPILKTCHVRRISYGLT